MNFAGEPLARRSRGLFSRPDRGYESAILIGRQEEQPAAIFPEGKYRFSSFSTAGNNHWTGLLIPDVKPIVDHASLSDPERDGMPLGCAVLDGGNLEILTKADNRHPFLDCVRISLSDGIPALPSNLRAGFFRWQLALGRGQNRRILFEADLQPGETMD